jgi:hypothetical protein
MYKFKMIPKTDEALVELQIIMPNPMAGACDLEGSEARKRLTKWILSSAAGMALSCGVDLQDALGTIFLTISEAIDWEHQRDLLVQAIRKAPRSPQDLEENPPETLSPEQARSLVQHLLDNGTLMLDDDLKLVLRSN